MEKRSQIMALEQMVVKLKDIDCQHEEAKERECIHHDGR